MPIGVVNILLLVTVMIGGLILGGPLGIGTVMAVFGQGIVLQIACKICKFEPRQVNHEGVAELYHAFKAYRAGKKAGGAPESAAETKEEEKTEKL